MTLRQQQYARRLNAIAARYADLEDETVQRALAMLQDLERRINAELATAVDFKSYRLRELQRRIDDLIAEFEDRLAGAARGAFGQVYGLGARSVTDPLQDLGIRGAFFGPSRAQVNAVLDFSADLIRNIGEDTRARINRQIGLAALGERSPLDAMRAVSKALGMQARAGAWAHRPDVARGVAARAETDLRTELQRTFNLATYSQQQATAQHVPDLRKAWVATADSRTRESHLKAHTQYRKDPIRIDEPYIIGPERVEMMYPLDPNGPVQEIVNCRCRSVTIHLAVGMIASTLDARIAKEMQRRQEENADARERAGEARQWAGWRAA